MGDPYSYKNVKQNKKNGGPRPGTSANRQVKAPRLQSRRGLHPSLKKSFSPSWSFPKAKEASTLQNSPCSEGEKKRRPRLTQVLLQTKDLRNRFAQRVHTTTTGAAPEKERSGEGLSRSFVNLIMVDGKKDKAEKIFSQTLKKLAGYLQGDVKRKDHKKKEINLLGKGESGPLLVISDQVEKRSVYSLLQRAINNVKPTLQVRKVRIARSIYQVPLIMKREKQEKNAVRWIIESAKKKGRYSGTSFSECLASSVLEAFTARGQAREKRDRLHRTAEANRGYLRFRWW